MYPHKWGYAIAWINIWSKQASTTLVPLPSAQGSLVRVLTRASVALASSTVAGLLIEFFTQFIEY